jgi:AraC-like DNA-binding protein
MKKPRHPWPVINTSPEFFSPQVSAARRFYSNLRPSKKIPLSIVSGGLEHCLPDYKIQRTGFPFYSIEYVVRGTGSLKLNGRNHALQPGTVFSYGPDTPHEIAADPNAPPVKYFVDFFGRRSVEILHICRLLPGSSSRMFPPHELQNLFDELIRCGQRGTPRANELGAKLLECLAMKIAESRIPQETGETPSFWSYQQCRRHIEENFQRLRTLEQLAGECRLNAAYLCRLFQRYDHQTPYQFLMRLKMTVAAEKLQEPGAMVKQVAERVGFRDQFHFSRAFKKTFSVAPNAFRRMR